MNGALGLVLSKFNSFDQVVFIFTFLNDRFLAVYHESILLLNGVIKRVALAIGQAPYFLLLSFPWLFSERKFDLVIHLLLHWVLYNLVSSSHTQILLVSVNSKFRSILLQAHQLKCLMNWQFIIIEYVPQNHHRFYYSFGLSSSESTAQVINSLFRVCEIIKLA